jgi:hypothetical protein
MATTSYSLELLNLTRFRAKINRNQKSKANQATKHTTVPVALLIAGLLVQQHINNNNRR